MPRFHWTAAIASPPRCVELNPVRARLAARAEDWPWSSARAYLAGRDDAVVAVAPLLGVIGDWRTFLNVAPADADIDLLRQHQRTGRPLGDDTFVDGLERALGRTLRRAKPGPKPKTGS